MATLTRPGVEITQVIAAEAPSVLTPTLMPCIIGPCFQMVEPLTSVGSLNASATVSTAARVVATATVADPIAAISGTTVTFLVNGVTKAITLPTSVGGAAISQSAIAQAINAGLGSSATAKFVSNKLEVSTAAKGSGASIKVVSPGTALIPLNLDGVKDILITGRGSYDNRTYVVPYTSLPSPLVTDMSELVVKGADLDLYRYFSGTLTAFSKDSAPNWNSYVGGDTKVNNVALTMVTQPAFSNPRTSLHGIKSTGAKTNKLAHLGKEASITIPLAGTLGGGAVKWPDSTGSAFLRVTALGYQNYRVSATNTIGNFVGSAGNAIKVAFTHAGGADSATWDANTKILTINKSNTTTFAQLEALVNGIGNAANDLIIEISYPTGAGASVCLGTVNGAAAWGANTKDFFLAGGVDPINFSADAGAPVNAATITGAVNVKTAKTNTQFGIAGKDLRISIDGGEWLPVNFDGASTPAVDINTALTGVGTAGLVTIANEEGVNVRCLRITASSTTGHDSTIELASNDPEVLDILFSGHSTATETTGAVAMANAWTTGAGARDGRRLVLESGDGKDYNVNAIAKQELAVVPGSLTITLNNAAVNGQIGYDFTSAQVLALNFNGATHDIKITHDPGGVLGAPTVLTITPAGPGAIVDVAGLAADLLAQIGALAGKVTVGVINGRLCISDTLGTSGVKVEAAGVGAAAVTALLNNVSAGAANALDAVTSSSVATSLTIKDTGTSNALQVTAVGDMSGVKWGREFAAAIDLTSTTDLTSLFLDSTGGFTYSNGTSPSATTTAGAVVLAGNSTEVVVVDKTPITATITAATTATVTYTRRWACSASAAAPSYTGRVFHGRSNKVVVGDKVWNSGAVLGVVNSIDAFSLGGTFTGAQLTLSEFAVDNSANLDNWYITAQNLPAAAPRPAPELTFSDVGGIATAKHALLRNSAGIALPGSATVYAQYSALRKDVTAASADPQLLVFNGVSEVEAILGDAVPANPLAFALSKAFEATSAISVSALGVSETTADAPTGTVPAYAEALDFLERKEVYALSPLSQNPEVHKLFSAHVTAMSEPAAKKERIALVNAALPTEKVPTVAMSGTATIASIGGDKHELTFSGNGINMITALDGLLDATGTAIVAGVGATLTPSQGVFVDRAGDALKYLVTKIVSSTVLQIEVGSIFGPDSGPGTGGNADAYYATATANPGSLADFAASGEACSVLVRQAAISKATTTGRSTLVATMADITGGAAGYQNRRFVWLQPESFNVSLGGAATKVPGYYHCASLAAMIGEQSPSQPYTNFPVPGYMAPVGSSDLFSESQMATAAAGGVWWAIQDSPGGSVFSRHQLTTNTANLKTRELSIVVAVDYVAKLVRNQVSRFIGRNNITKSLLTSISIGVSGSLASVVGSVVAGASLDRIAQDAANPDTVLVDVSITPFYPANTIKITIYV